MKRLIFIFALLLCTQLFAQQDNFSNPQMLGASNYGKEYWFSVPPCFEDQSLGFANFIKIFVTSPFKTLVTVEVSGRGYFKAKSTVPNDVIEFNITPFQGSPWTNNEYGPTPPDAIYQGTGIHVFADQPIIVYCVVRYHWISDGFLAIPVSSLGREYIATSAGVDPTYWQQGYRLPTTICVTAAYDDTKVRFTVGGNPLTRTTGGLKPGDSKDENLMKGDVIVVSTDVANGDLSGSKVVSTKPVSVVSGNFCSNVPIGNNWCDYTAEMEIPAMTWGLDLPVPKIPNRKYSSIIKIVAKEPNTKIYRNGTFIGTIATSGGAEGKGFLSMRMTQDSTPGSVVISGDKPIAVTLYNTGTQEDGDSLKSSDPFTMAIIPVSQYLKDLMFCTPNIQGGQWFPLNYINLIYENNSLDEMSDSLLISEPMHGGTEIYHKVKDIYAGTDEKFLQTVDGKSYSVKCINLVKDGVYRIKSDKPFAAYSFGFSDYDSYGYPSGMNLIDLEVQDTVPPNPTWTVWCDGNVMDGVVTDMPEDKTIRSNLSMIVFHSDLSYNYVFKYVDFVPGETRTTNWTLNVIDPFQDARAVITFTDRRGNDTTIQIDYYATKLAVRPTPCNFGKFKTGETKTLDFWVVNYSDQSSATVKQLKLWKNNVGFTINLPAPLPWTIGAMDPIKFTVTFTAQSEGYCFDSIGVGDDCQFFYRAKVEANVENPIIFVDDVTFDAMLVGNTATKDFHVFNEGNNPLEITGYTGPSLSIYTTSLPLIDNSNPFILNPKETQTFQVQFRPTAFGKFKDSIVFISDAGTNRKNVCYINGEGRLTGINEFENKSLNIHNLYPEPSSGLITIKTNLEGDISSEIQITDIAGRQVRTLNADLSRETKFDFSSLSEGVYLMKIKAGRETLIKKFTIKR